MEDVLEELIARVPPPEGDPEAPPRALIFDSEFDHYRGVVAYVRVVDGTFRKGEPIRAMATGTEADIDDIGFFTPQMTPVESLGPGEVGYVITGVKDVTKLRVGDTLTSRERPAIEALPGYREVKPMVFCGLFPIDSDQFPELRDALEKLTLNDAALSLGARDLATPWASAFAAASSACCTWTSCASAWSASTTSSCWPRCHRRVRGTP